MQLRGLGQTLPIVGRIPPGDRMQPAVLANWERAGLLVADRAVAIGQHPVERDGDAGDGVHPLAHRGGLQQRHQAVGRAGDDSAMGAPGPAEITPRFSRIALEHAVQVLVHQQAPLAAALDAHDLFSGLERNPLIAPAELAVAAVLDVVVDLIHEPVGDAPGQPRVTAHQHHRDARDGRSHQIGAAADQDGLVPDRWQAVALQVRIVAEHRGPTRRAMPRQRPVVRGLDRRQAPGDRRRDERLRDPDPLEPRRVEALQVRVEQLPELAVVDPREIGLDDELLDQPLGLRQTLVGHQLHRQQDILGAPGLRTMACQDQLERPAVRAQVLVDPGAVGLDPVPRRLSEVGHLVAGVPEEAHAPHVAVDADHLLGAGQLLGCPALPDQPHEGHLNQPVVSVGPPEPEGQVGETGGVDADDAVAGAAERQGPRGAAQVDSSSGEQHARERMIALLRPVADRGREATGVKALV